MRQAELALNNEELWAKWSKELYCCCEFCNRNVWQAVETLTPFQKRNAEQNEQTEVALKTLVFAFATGSCYRYDESADYDANYFTNLKASAYFNPSLEFYSNGGWHNSQSGHSYAFDHNPTSAGMRFDCNGFDSINFLGDTLMSSAYAPPPITGSYVIYC